MARIIGLLSLVLVAAGCGGGADAPANPDVVTTLPNEGFAFSQAKTFALADDVAEITDPPQSSSLLTADTKTLILDEIAQNMTERGYVQVTDTSGPKPDVIAQASVIQTTSTDVYYSSWYPYWGSYYGTWYGGYYGAGWAPVTVPYVVSSTLGSLVIELTDPNSPNPVDKKIPSVWVGVVTGAIDDTGAIPSTARIQNGIAQAFEQSPYLQGAP